MSVLDYIIEGIEAELALERELGVRSIELSAPLEPLASPKRVEQAKSAPLEPPQVAARVEPIKVAPEQTVVKAAPVAAAPIKSASSHPAASGTADYDFVFLHHAPLSEDGRTMMAKIVEGMHKTPESAPIVCELPIPKAKVYVILGARALAKFRPDLKAAPGQWLKTEKGAEVLVTYSPEYILRFKTVTPAVRKMKGEMWLPLRALGERFKGDSSHA